MGRHPEDLRYLSFKYKQQLANPVNGTSLESRIYGLTNNRELQKALKICSQNTRPDQSDPVDQALVYRDVEDIIKILRATFPESNNLYNILLRRSDTHIQQLALFYEMKEHMKLDEAIRKNAVLDKMTIKIAVHAVRTAINMTYRDAMLLRDSLGGDALFGTLKSVRLGIRVCRMHWHKQHWLQIKSEFLGMGGQQLVDKLNSKCDGLLKELVVRMAMV